VHLELPPVLRTERAPDGSGWAWIVDGPRVLAERLAEPAVDPFATDARMGHIARGDLLPLASAPILTPGDVLAAEREGRTLTLPATPLRREVVLEPFAALHDDRYTLSFPFADDADVARRRSELAEEDARADVVDARTMDVLTFGQQQPESDHALTLVDSESGYDDGVHWRRFRAPARFVLQDWGASASVLRLSWLADSATRHLTIRVADAVVEDRAVKPGDAEERTVDVDLSDLADGRSEWVVTVGGGAEGTPRLTETRLMSAPIG
jgi:hypothetical protein